LRRLSASSGEGARARRGRGLGPRSRARARLSARCVGVWAEGARRDGERAERCCYCALRAVDCGCGSRCRALALGPVAHALCSLSIPFPPSCAPALPPLRTGRAPVAPSLSLLRSLARSRSRSRSRSRRSVARVPARAACLPRSLARWLSATGRTRSSIPLPSSGARSSRRCSSGASQTR
jgi:hypothetical protein